MLRSMKLSLAGAVVAMAGMSLCQAQVIEKMKQFKVANTNLNIPTVAQEGKNADAIRKNLEKIKLPAGFKVELFAIVPDARHMAVGHFAQFVKPRYDDGGNGEEEGEPGRRNPIEPEEKGHGDGCSRP